jgi:hypothetical protein
MLKALREGVPPSELKNTDPPELMQRVTRAGGLDGKPVVIVHPTWCGLPADSEVRMSTPDQRSSLNRISGYPVS